MSIGCKPSHRNTTLVIKRCNWCSTGFTQNNQVGSTEDPNTIFWGLFLKEEWVNSFTSTSANSEFKIIKPINPAWAEGGVHFTKIRSHRKASETEKEGRDRNRSQPRNHVYRHKAVPGDTRVNQT